MTSGTFIDDLKRGDRSRPLVIAGPCSAESRNQVLETACALADKGVDIFRAGVWKPRSRPGSFEGAGEAALEWMSEVSRMTGMKTGTEVAKPEHVEAALRYGTDVLWIGARTAADPFAVQEIAESLRGVSVPVFLKNPVNPDLELWIGGIERLRLAGVRNLGAVHRGFSSYAGTVYRNVPCWSIPLEFMRRMPDVPLLCDPSHIAGKRELVPALVMQGLNLGYDGLIIESHIDPDNALSDASQQLRPDDLGRLLEESVFPLKRNADGLLDGYRMEIDAIDEQIVSLLSKRMSVSRKIGEYKKANSISVFQQDRYEKIMERCAGLAEASGLDPEFMKRIMSEMHEESVRLQMEN